MSKSIKDMNEIEFNSYMTRRLVKEGKGSSLTPSKTAWVKMKDSDLGKIGFGILPDVPNKAEASTEWDDVAGSSEGGKKGGTAGPSEKAESMWTNRDLDPSIMVYMENHPRGLRIKLNRNNKILTDLFITGMDAKYNTIMDELIDEIFVYLRSIGSMLRDCETKIKESVSAKMVEDHPYEDESNYFLDNAFKNWWADSKNTNKLVKILTDKKKDM